MHAPGNARGKVAITPRPAPVSAGRELFWYRALVIVAGLGLVATIVIFFKAASDPASVRAWLPILGPLVGASIAVNFGIMANAIQTALDRRRAARADALLAADPELAARIAANHAALLRQLDNES